MMTLVELVDKFDEVAQAYGYYSSEGIENDVIQSEKEYLAAKQELLDAIVDATKTEAHIVEPVKAVPRGRKILWERD